MSRRGGERVRPERVAERIRVFCAQLLSSELRDPRVRPVTLTRVQVSTDLKHAKLYVSVLGDETTRAKAMRALEGATGFVRRQLSTELSLRSTPEIRFVFDPSVEYGIRLEELVHEIEQRSAEEASPETASDE